MNEILIIIFLILLNGLFSMSEIAVISARKSSLASEEKKGSKAATTALKLACQPEKFLSTVQIGIPLSAFLPVYIRVRRFRKISGNFCWNGMCRLCMPDRWPKRLSLYL